MSMGFFLATLSTWLLVQISSDDNGLHAYIIISNNHTRTSRVCKIAIIVKDIISTNEKWGWGYQVMSKVSYVL